MDISRQRLQTVDIQAWISTTRALLLDSRELLNDLNTFPVPNFNTGSNLAATWSEIDAVAQKLPVSAKPGHFLSNVAAGIVRYPHGCIGQFLASAFTAAGEAAGDALFLRPADLVMIAEGIDLAWERLDGTNSVSFGLSALSNTISEQLAELDILTLSQVVDTALVCAQQATVDSADVNRGAGDAGLAGMCLILAVLADLVGELEDESVANVNLVSTMLSEWADRSRSVSANLSQTYPGGEFAVTFCRETLADDADQLRESLRSTCSEILIHDHVDAIGVGRFVTHVHTPTPLAALPQPRDNGVLISHLTLDDTPSITPEDPLERIHNLDNVVLLSRQQPHRQPRRRAHVVVLSQAPALAEILGRSGATVLLAASDTAQLQWSLRQDGNTLAIMVPASAQTVDLARTLRESGESFALAPTADELSALLLVERLQNSPYLLDETWSVSDAQSYCEQSAAQLRVEPLGEDLDQQLRDMPPGEVLAIIGAANTASDRAKLQMAQVLVPEVELSAFYGGQPGDTVIGVRARV